MGFKVKIGQIYWDREKRFTNGNVDMVNLILSGDMNHETKKFYYAVAQFMWADGYCGAPIVKFTEDKILQMELVGSIEQIKSF